jgi:hypothetical protein
MTEFVQFDKYFLSEYDLKLHKFDQKLFHHIEVFESLSNVSLLIHNNGLLGVIHASPSAFPQR